MRVETGLIYNDIFGLMADLFGTAYDPPVSLGPPSEVLTELVAALPTSLASGSFRAQLYSTQSA